MVPLTTLLASRVRIIYLKPYAFSDILRHALHLQRKTRLFVYYNNRQVDQVQLEDPGNCRNIVALPWLNYCP